MPEHEINFEQWEADGFSRFGPDVMQWRFVCPSCGNVAAVGDFEPYKDKGAMPTSATCECIGRYTGATDAFDPGNRPCNYAGYGLFRLSPVTIIKNGTRIEAFAFAEPPK